mgnify:CR=1 FL=1
MKKIAILQPNYIPWKGVFDLINRVDVFVFYDDVQYTTKDWRNRNKIKTPQGDLWLTVPVRSKGLRGQKINDAMIDGEKVNWQQKHLESIRNSYKKAPFFRQYEHLLDEIYVNHVWEKISDLDIYATRRIAESLSIDAEWHRSSDLDEHGAKDGEKVLRICETLGCDYFLNGPTAKPFMDERLFEEKGVALEFIDYDYAAYPQLHGPFTHHVTVLDVMFNCGPSARGLVCGE